jgi:hypothetical protein
MTNEIRIAADRILVVCMPRPLKSSTPWGHVERRGAQRAQYHRSILVRRFYPATPFAAGFTLPKLLFTGRDAAHIVSATTRASLLFSYTALIAGISFLSRTCCRTRIGKSGNEKQQNKRKEFEPETHRLNLSVKAAPGSAVRLSTRER